MRDFNLSASIDLKTKEFEAKAKKAEEAIKKIEDEILNLRKQKLSIQTKESKGSIKAVNQELSEQNIKLKETRLQLQRNAKEAKNYAQSIKSAGNAQGQFRNQVGASNSVALEFNRIIQDAPFGIVGIGNNIQQLTANFAQLKAGSASTGQAILSSLKSIISPINLVLLGVSVLTSAWTAYTLGIFDAKESTEDLKDELEEFIKTLSNLDQARIKGASSAEKELRTLKDLKIQAEDTNIPLKVRLEAVRDLKKESPEYLGTLTDEQLLLGQVGDAYEILTKNIIATAKARAFSEKIGENSIEIFKREERALERTNELLEAREKLARQEKIATSSGAQVAGQVTNVDTEVIRTQELINSLVKEQTEDVAEINRIKEESLALEAQINGQLEIGGKFTKSILKGNEDLNLSLDDTKTKLGDIDKLIENLLSSFAPVKIEDFDIDLGDTPPQLDLAGFNAPASDYRLQLQLIEEAYRKLVEASTETGVSLEKLQENFNKLLESEALDILEGGLRDFASGFVDSLNISNNALEGFVSQVIGAVPKIISAFVKLSLAKKAKAAADLAADQASAVGGGIALSVESAKALGPAGAIALPIILGGVLSLISGAFGKVGGSGGGGFAGASASYGASSTSFSAGGLGFQGFSGLTLTSEVSGTDLKLAITRSENTEI